LCNTKFTPNISQNFAKYLAALQPDSESKTIRINPGTLEVIMQKNQTAKQNQPTQIQTLLKNMPISDRPALSSEELMLQAAEISKQAAAQLGEERKAIRQKRANDLMSRSVIPTRYRDADLTPKCTDQGQAFIAGKAFVDDFSNRLQTGAGMVLWGDIGTGKTHLACAIANALITQLRSVLYCTALEAVMLVKSSWKRGNEGMTEYDIYERFGDPELLIIDEIGVQIGSDFERMVLTSIADIRSRNCRPTIIISNHSPEEIYGLLGERMFDRLVGFGANVIHMQGRSMRLRAV
jgi:DNA replication protein DnaC